MLLIIDVPFIIYFSSNISSSRNCLFVNYKFTASLHNVGTFKSLFLKSLIYLSFKSYCRIICFNYSSLWVHKPYINHNLQSRLFPRPLRFNFPSCLFACSHEARRVHHAQTYHFHRRRRCCRIVITYLNECSSSRST